MNENRLRKTKKKKNNESFVTLFPHKINNKIKDSR